MTDERPTIRPVTLSRLIETTHFCGDTAVTTEDLEAKLGVSHRRARSTILEAKRIHLIEPDDDDSYDQTTVGSAFVEAVQKEHWDRVSQILHTHSPHYKLFLEVLEESGPVRLDRALEFLDEKTEFTPYMFNQATIEVVGDWGERLGAVQRNAFTGEYYLRERDSMPANFGFVLLEVYNDIEETAGVGMRQRHLSIPELRETLCGRLGATRDSFDEALARLASQNVGKVELSGAPMDTGAKDAAYGIKEMRLADDEELISTSQSTERIMAGIEQFGKQYYYLTIHDENITYTQESET